MVDSLRSTHTMTGNVADAENDPESVDRRNPAYDALYAKLHAWLEHERDRQAENRAEMAIDGDYYDGLQWTEEDAQEIEARGQAPLVFNETKVSIDWILGAEKRNRVDWRVLPREESDSEGAEVRSKVLKFLSDTNRLPFMRSQAFAEACISGLSWLEDSLSMDATDDVLYSGGESWRNVLHDSYHKRPDGKDMRYLFRWRYIDLDVAQAMWPTHADALQRQAQAADQLSADADDELWYLGANMRDPQTNRSGTQRYLSSTGSSVGSDRCRVKIYEAWYREPTQAKVLYGGPYHGDVLSPDNPHPAHRRALDSGACDAIPAIVLRVRLAFMTESEVLEDCETPFAHNQLPLTPLYCFRRSRDGMPYGHVRPMRDPQMDMNKRMSKSLFLLSVNQLITEKRAFSTEKDGYTLEDAIANVANPQGVFVLEHGDAKFEIRRDFQEIRGHAEILALDRMFLQSASGVTDELLGRRTNATSGVAITARQDQGSLTTAGIFDNFRLAIGVSGQKALSNVERFYSMPKVIRLTESQVGEQQPKISWVKINEPELQPDGSVKFLNDITQSRADFIVDEQDYRASMRQAMFDQLLEMLKIIAPVAPAIAVGMLDLIVDANDFPGKEQFIQRVRELLAEAKGQMSPEQQAQAAEAANLQKRAAAAEIAAKEAQADKTDAEADTIRASLNAGMVAVDLERVDQADAPPAAAGIPSMAAATRPPSAALPQADSASSPAAAPPTAGAQQMPTAAAQQQPAAAPPQDFAAVLAQQGQQLAQMMARQAAMASQQAAALRADVLGALNQLAQIMIDDRQREDAAPPAMMPRNKVIRITDADGREITATVEHQ
jgi:hypothetical protein